MHSSMAPAFSAAITSLALLLPAAADEGTTVAHSYTSGDEDLNCDIGFDVMRTELLADDNVRLLSSNELFEAYEIPQEYSVITLTKDTHYAHPMLVVRKIVQQKNTISISMKACGWNSRDNSDRLFEEFEKLNEEIKQDFATGNQ